jgi:PIN domain nuclease of toxin-antitoxin system
MRVLIDTCIFIHFALDRSLLSNDVLSILEDYDNTICVSAETPRELVIQYNNGKVVSKYWKSARQMIPSSRL